LQNIVPPHVNATPGGTSAVGDLGGGVGVGGGGGALLKLEAPVHQLDADFFMNLDPAEGLSDLYGGGGGSSSGGGITAGQGEMHLPPSLSQSNSSGTAAAAPPSSSQDSTVTKSSVPTTSAVDPASEWPDDSDNIFAMSSSPDN
jgi:hypothetical protein